MGKRAVFDMNRIKMRPHGGSWLRYDNLTDVLELAKMAIVPRMEEPMKIPDCRSLWES